LKFHRAWGGWLALAPLAFLVLGPDAARADDSYDVRYEARLLPTERSARVEIRIRQSEWNLRSLEFRIDPERHLDWSGDGYVQADDDSVLWEIPKGGGTLRYVFRIDHLRDDHSYDARSASEWAIFRGDDLVPPARARTRVGATSRSRLRLRLPEGWSSVTPYPRERSGSYRVEHPGRGFDRPTGWMLAARRLGVVREEVAGIAVAIAGPTGQGLHRLDLLALLRWTLPELRKTLPELPERVLLVGAGDPMWRGGLSGPGSVFIHAARPLITPDGTSPVLHELMHVLLPRPGGPSEDWLIEGLAEYYSLAVLRRSRTLSEKRHAKALAGLATRGARVKTVRVERSEGDVTARAVTLLAELDRLLREASGGERSLDDVLHQLGAADVPLALGPLRAASEKVAGTSLEAFFARPVFSTRGSGG
jgi:hypothetical protein